MSDTRGDLVAWLIDNSFAEERPGYGHVDAEVLADALIGAGWVADWRMEYAARLKAAYDAKRATELLFDLEEWKTAQGAADPDR